MRSEIYAYPIQDSTPAVLRQEPYPYPRAWTRETLRAEDWRFALPEACLAELDAVVEGLRRQPLPTLVLKPRDFALEACAAFMGRIKAALDHGPGMANVERLPMERYSHAEAGAAYWLLGSLLGRPVAQKWNGLMIYDVMDTGAEHVIGVRGSVTNSGQNFHTDNSYARMPPQYVGLLCLHPAKEGGMSRVVSWHTVYNELLERCPHLLPRAFRPFLYERNCEHPPDEPRVLSKPMMFPGETLKVCFSTSAITDGYEVSGQALDAEGEELIAAIRQILADRRLHTDFHFRAGELQFVNNGTVGHSRTAFRDHPEPERKRHLIRLWFREQGRISYDG